jgi:hypothetical protein
MKGELPSLFFAFAFLINGEKGARCLERHRWAFAARCIQDSRHVKSSRSAVPTTIHPEEGE